MTKKRSEMTRAERAEEERREGLRAAAEKIEVDLSRYERLAAEARLQAEALRAEAEA